MRSIIFVVNNKYIKKYQYEFINTYKKNPNFSVLIMLYEKNQTNHNKKFTNILWKLIELIEKHRFKKNKLFEYNNDVYIEADLNIKDKFNGVDYVCDILINLTDYDLPKDFIKFANYGLIQARAIDVMRIHNNNEIFSKYNKNSQSIIIELYVEDKVYYNNYYISNLKYYYLNSVNSKIRSLEFLKQRIDSKEIIGIQKFHNNYIINNNIPFNKIIKYVLSQFIILINGKILQFMYKYKKWSVCICNYSFENGSLQLTELFEISDKKRGYADPFLINYNNRKLCFLEDYSIETGKGDISLFEITDNGPIFLGRIIKEDFHLSFPYVFEYNNSLYLVPESCKNKDIRLYKCIDFPLHWEVCKVLKNDISAVDTLILRKDGLWWMLTNVNKYNNDESSSELHIFYSNDLINSKWVEHTKNPVSVSINNGRNGGLFLLDQKIYRVGQRQKSYMYGHSFTLNLITKLDKDTYEEKPIITINPPSGYDGTHHLTIFGNLAAYDQYK